MADAGVFDELVASVLERREAALNQLRSAKLGDGKSIDLAAKYSNVERTFVDSDARVVLVLSLARKVPVRPNDPLIPKTFIEPILSGLQSIQGRYQHILDGFTNLDGQGGPGTINSETGIFTSGNSQTNYKFGGSIIGLWNDCDALLAALYPLMFAIRPKGRINLTPLLESFRSALKQTQTQYEEIEKLVKEARTLHQKVEEFASEDEPISQELARVTAEASKERTTISEYASEATQAVTSIRAINEQAEQLRAAVTSYKASFESFQKQLDQREAILDAGTERQNELLASVDVVRTQIEGLNARAEAMLSGATVAGLASSFGSLRDKLQNELWWARLAFYVSIGLLFISVLPLAVYVIPGLGEWLTGNPQTIDAHSATGAELAGQIAARALLLLPFAWLTKFAARRHAMLFKLKEHYAYKYSVASSVEGFKQQAEPYKDQIAAATFFELTFNPANRIDATNEEERPPNPIIDQLLKRMTGGKD
ncbi:MAG: hypothetical protein ACTHNH_10275 [Mesorhizobium sp.]